MKYRDIVIENKRGFKLEFYPPYIMAIKIEENRILIMESEGEVRPITTWKLEKEKYPPSAWNKFIKTLNTYFVL